MKIAVKFWDKLTLSEREEMLSRSETDIRAVTESVQKIVDAVRLDGDKALVSFTSRFDGVDLDRIPLAVTPEEFDQAEDMLDQDVKEAIRYSIENVRRFHAAQKSEGVHLLEIRPGVFAGERATPIPSAGLYVPRGRGSFPSMLYMLAVPAMIAQVPRVCVVSPPGEDGSLDPACLYAARLCGISEVYRIGGAQAVAALALGTETIKRVDKIIGPGSMYVAAAKRILHESVDAGLPAGPSESIVLADSSADPWKVALDLLVEAEHGSDSSAILITPSVDLAERVAGHLSREIEELPEPRKTFVKDVFSNYGGIVVTSAMEDAVELVNCFATEHLQIQTRDPFEILPKVQNAGEILLGEHVPFSAANYSVGANAVLPTGGKAKTYSAVSVRDFQKFSSVVYMTEGGLGEMKHHVATLSDYEGFHTHGNAIRKRDHQGKESIGSGNSGEG